MKTGNCYIILIAFLLFFAGCARKDNLKHPESRKNLSIQPIESRFQDITIENMAREKELSVKDTSPYYLPEWPLEKLSQIIVQNQHIQINEIRKTGYQPKSSYFDRLPAFLKAGQTSPDAFFTAIFDNDILDYTDRYYTNGIGFELYHPVISASPLIRILPGLNYGINYYGLSFAQNMYTPLKLNKPEILVGDRPFASYLILSHHRISLSPEGHRRLQSELTLGIIGPGSFGKIAQDLIHDEEPIGWMYQVQNDFIVNYSIRFDQGIYSGERFELAAVAGGQAGTLYDNLAAGLFLQYGKANNRYTSIFQTTDQQKPYKNRLRYYFSLNMMNKLIVYDATLQGGMFNKENVYKLSNDQLKRYVFTGTASFGVGFGKYSLEVSQVFLTPEFEGGRRHMWLRIRNIIKIN